MGNRLEGKRAIVTGAGQGIGESIARLFAAHGAHVVVGEINVSTGQAVVEGIRTCGGSAELVETDVTDDRQVKRLIEVAGDVDILVNNAGSNVFHEPLQMADLAWDQCMDLDLKAAWSCARATLPGMLQRGAGVIVNIASAHSFKIIPHCFPYPVAKHGLIGLTRALAIEYAAQGIRVNAIAPGYIDTPIAEAYWATFADPAAERVRVEEIHPPKRIGRPDEVAHTALFLASDEAPFINAETIVIDGGRSALYHE